jgi:hypothetical protein
LLSDIIKAKIVPPRATRAIQAIRYHDSKFCLSTYMTMNVNKIEIKTESLPARCEICHQSDLFEPATEHCQRCYQVALAVKEELLAKIPAANAVDKREASQHDFNKIISSSAYNRLIEAILFVLPLLLAFSLTYSIKFLAITFLGIAPFVSFILGLYAGLYFSLNFYRFFPAIRSLSGQIDNKTVQRLIAAGTDQNGFTPLIWAATQGNTKLVKSLLAAGANANEPDIHGFTPLFYCISNYREPQQLEMIKLLLDAGADVNLKIFTGMTALTLTQSLNHRDIVSLIKAHN